MQKLNNNVSFGQGDNIISTQDLTRHLNASQNNPYKSYEELQSHLQSEIN